MMVIDMKKVNEINQFINSAKQNVNNQYRLKYHMMPPVGWMNDPNGLVYINGEYHLFYQFNPYNTLPGTMLWGHFKTEDLIKYQDESVAIVPDLEHASIFSGGAINIDNKINAVYTLHYEHDGYKKEEVYLITSNDSINFINNKCVFDNEKLPKNISRADFRDPFPVKINEDYYIFIGGKDEILNKGVIVVLKGKSLEELEYFFTIGPLFELGDMGECPSYYRVGNKDVLLASGCRVPNVDNDFKNSNSSVFIVGDIDFTNGKMNIDFVKEIDKGDTFYAPQFINGAKDPIIIGWLEMWDKPYKTHELKHGWSGAFSIPRKLSIKENDIYQEPINLDKYHKEYSNNSKCLDISFKALQKGEFVISSGNNDAKIILDKHLYLDTNNSNNLNGCLRRTNNNYDFCSVRILLDVSSIEVFVSGGKEVISSRIFLDGDYNISFNENIIEVDIKELDVI